MVGRKLIIRWRAAPLAALAVLAGCGGGSTTTVQQGNAPGLLPGLSATMTATGPTDITENLNGLLAQNQKQLEDVQLQCPDEPSPPNYPVNCTITAIDTSKPSRRSLPDGKHRHISGTLTVLGVYPRTQTYAYRLEYQPKFAQK